MRKALAIAFAALFLPSAASALTFVQIISFFHVVVGLLLTFTLLVFFSGVFVYIARLGTWPSFRETAIRVLEWAVVLLFVLVVMLALLRYFQFYPTIMLTALAFIIIVGIAIYLLRAGKGEKKDDKH